MPVMRDMFDEFMEELQRRQRGEAKADSSENGAGKGQRPSQDPDAADDGRPAASDDRGPATDAEPAADSSADGTTDEADVDAEPQPTPLSGGRGGRRGGIRT